VYLCGRVDDGGVDGRGNLGSGGVEWLDLGPAPWEDATQTRRRRPGRWWWIALVAAALIALVVVALTGRSPKRGASPAGHTPTTPVRPASSSLPGTPTTTAPAATAPVTITAIGHPLLDAPADWELFGRGQDVVVRIQLALGRITRTAVPGLSGGGGVSFVVGPDRVIIHPLDLVPGYLVPDGHPARDLPATFAQGGPALPGPDRQHLWVQSGRSRQAMTLVDFGGTPTGVSLTFPSDLGPASSDSAGYLLYFGTGGIYQARPDGLRRVTTGTLLAGGPTRWLTVDCDYRYHCATNVTDRSSGAQRHLNTPVDTYAPGGVISPDGNTAVVLQNANSAAATALYLLDLSSGAARRTAVSISSNQDNGGYGSSFVWSPDSRWLFVDDAKGRLLVLDSHTGHAVDLGVNLPPLSQLALRSTSR
jgi:hypothetical protein